MHALNRTDRTMPVIAGNYLHHPAGDELGGRDDASHSHRAASSGPVAHDRRT